VGKAVWFMEHRKQEQTNTSRKAHEPYECKVVERHYLGLFFSVTYWAQMDFTPGPPEELIGINP